MLGHEKLAVYQRSIEFFAVAVQVVDNIPKGNGTLVDQLRRVAISIPLNIAEEQGKYLPLTNGDFTQLHEAPRWNAARYWMYSKRSA